MNLVWIILAAWHEYMLIQLGTLVSFIGLSECFIGVWSINLLVEHLLLVFLFSEGAWFDTFDFSFSGFPAVVPYGPRDVQELLLRQAPSWWPLNPFASSNFGAAFVRRLFFGAIQGPNSLYHSIVEVLNRLPWRRACLAHLHHTLFLDVDFSLALIWLNFCTSNCQTRYVGQRTC